MVASAVRSVIEQPDGTAARAQLDRVIDGLWGSAPGWPSCSPRPSPTCSPTSRSPSPTGARSGARTRSSGSTRRSRTAVVGIFPTRASLIRLVGMVLFEQDDEWQDGRRYFRPETMAALNAPPTSEEVNPALLMAS
jgi:putative transposase